MFLFPHTPKARGWHFWTLWRPLAFCEWRHSESPVSLRFGSENFHTNETRLGWGVKMEEKNKTKLQAFPFKRRGLASQMAGRCLNTLGVLVWATLWRLCDTDGSRGRDWAIQRDSFGHVGLGSRHSPLYYLLSGPEQVALFFFLDFFGPVYLNYALRFSLNK